MESAQEQIDRYIQTHSHELGTAIHDLWTARDEELWQREPYYYLRLGETADRLGQAMFAHDVYREGLDKFPDNLRIKQLYSLSLIKCGFLFEARDILSELASQGHDDEETLGILGRVYKEMWLMSDDLGHLRRSRHLYLKAFTLNRGYYSGINAASLSLILGEEKTANKLARMVIKICLQQLSQSKNVDYWTIATLGEAYTLLAREEPASLYFQQARALIGNRYSEMASTRRQLKILTLFSDVAADMLEIMTLPPVAAFTGHMIDAPGRRTSRFPASIESDIMKQISAVIGEREVSIGYSSAAAGSDILFLECLQNRGGETNIVLPFDRQEFITHSVRQAGDAWVDRHKRTLNAATQVWQTTRGDYSGDDLLFTYANRIIMGQAILRSRQLETEPLLIAVWDGKQNGRPGGTAEFVELWSANRFPTRIIDPTAFIPSQEPAQVIPNKTQATEKPVQRPKTIKRETVSILYSDLVGFSKLGENQIPHFIQGFLGTLAGRLRHSAYQPDFKNLWGDAMLFVFKDHVVAAEYALELRDLVRDTDWDSLNLPHDLNIRIGLHVGPVFTGKEPLLKRWNLFGSHVNQAARIEPITSPGNVYASDAFAALLTADLKNRLDCRYVGEIVLPKEFGSYPIYHIKRKTEIE